MQILYYLHYQKDLHYPHYQDQKIKRQQRIVCLIINDLTVAFLSLNLFLFTLCSVLLTFCKWPLVFFTSNIFCSLLLNFCIVLNICVVLLSYLCLSFVIFVLFFCHICFVLSSYLCCSSVIFVLSIRHICVVLLSYVCCPFVIFVLSFLYIFVALLH